MEREAADSLGLTLPGELMQRAGEAAFQVTREAYPNAQHWLVLVVTATTAVMVTWWQTCKAQGFNVTLLAHEGDKPLPEEAQQAHDAGLTPVALFMLLILTG